MCRPAITKINISSSDDVRDAFKVKYSIVWHFRFGLFTHSVSSEIAECACALRVYVLHRHRIVWKALAVYAFVRNLLVYYINNSCFVFASTTQSKRNTRTVAVRRVRACVVVCAMELILAIGWWSTCCVEPNGPSNTPCRMREDKQVRTRVGKLNVYTNSISQSFVRPVCASALCIFPCTKWEHHSLCGDAN